MEDIIKPSDLKNDLERAEKLGDKRLLFLYSNLYNEYFVDLLYKTYIKNDEYKKCSNPNCQKFLIPKFKQQVKRLSEISIIDHKNKHDEVIDMIFDIRNELSHQLKYNIYDLEKRFEKIQKDSLIDDTGIITKTLNKMDSWEKIKLSVFAVVTALYKEYEKLNSRKPKQTIEFRIDHDGKMVSVELIEH